MQLKISIGDSSLNRVSEFDNERLGNLLARPCSDSTIREKTTFIFEGKKGKSREAVIQKQWNRLSLGERLTLHGVDFAHDFAAQQGFNTVEVTELEFLFDNKATGEIRKKKPTYGIDINVRKSYFTKGEIQATFAWTEPTTEEIFFLKETFGEKIFNGQEVLLEEEV